MSVELKPINIDWEITSSNRRVNELVDVLYTELNLGRLKVSAKKELLRTILMNLLRSVNIKRGILYSRNNAWYQSIPSKYKYHFQTYDFVIKVVDALLEKGYITHLKGSWDMSSKYKEQSCINPSNKLLEFYNHLSTDVIEYRPPAQEVVLRNILTEEKPNLKTGKKEKTKKRVFIDYTDTAETIRMRKIIKDWNDLRSKTKISLDIPKQMYNADAENERLMYYCDLHEDNEIMNFVFKPKGAYRTFVYDFNKFGRFSAAIESLVKKEYRPYFKINGEPTIELDFQALHIRMLYNMEGVDYQEDPYQNAADSYDNEEYKVRKYFKLIGLMAINAKTETSTIRSVVTELKESQIDIPHKDIKKMLKHWLTIHAPIAQYLCSGIGLTLMYKDSNIAEKVIQHFTNRGIMVMCVHDSFIISQSYEQDLKSIMETSYQSIMGNNFRAVIDRK